jgi:D-alanyl-D-alanine carboxypeptidase/D-alanyl-D-alanine-endopeptidase (penicillin-binding protein 4)
MWKLTCIKAFLILTFEFLLLSSCSIEKQIARSAKTTVLDNIALKTAHVGISIFDPSENKYLYNYQGDKYFVPASNTKIPTCYAAMKYLGDSLVGLRYAVNYRMADSGMFIKPTADPTFLHPDFKKHPVYDFLKDTKRKLFWKYTKREFNSWGLGWSWNDYMESYMVERSTFPIYGNLVIIIQKEFDFYTVPKYFQKDVHLGQGFKRPIERSKDENIFYFDTIPANRKFNIPFVAGELTIKSLVQDTIKSQIFGVKTNEGWGDNLEYNILYSQPTDSLLKPMMHRSDNFFAEQSLLMVSNEFLGVMNDNKIIDTLLKTDFKDLPQKPRWADGSGLSRYNLFTPQDFVAILNKMKDEFGMDRIKVIFPTGGEGTISSYYKADSGYIYGKTGTLSGVVAFSGFLYTKKGKLLIFSTLINNHQASATDIRRAIEKFLKGIRSSY